MALPISTDNLLSGKVVEWERLEFKKSWDKLEAIQAICAFANDINNWGGGYIIFGIEEKDGQPILPPSGINIKHIDQIQKELLSVSKMLKPPYSPIAEPLEYMGKFILVVWVPGSEVRPHKAPSKFSNSKPQDYKYFIRRFSSTVVASQKEEIDLIETSSRTPYDDQINQKADIKDLSISLIREHLAKVGSDLLAEIDILPFTDLCRKMGIVSGPPEYTKPKNIGLLLFSENPEKYFPGAKIDIVIFRDQAGTHYTEKSFAGPIQRQLQDALVYLKNTVIEEKVIKTAGESEAIRLFSYPYNAIEEALVNTVYHRSYSDDNPIEIRIYPDHIDMLSYPGPLPPLDKTRLNEAKISARKYRNRRMGDFLKELRLTEGRGTGIPTILSTMEANMSPPPIFDTDDNLSYFQTTLPVNTTFLDTKGSTGIQDSIQDSIQDRAKMVLKYCKRPKKKQEILDKLGLFNGYNNYTRHVKPLVDKGWLTLTIPSKPTSKNQQYRTTPDGIKYLEGTSELPARSIPENRQQSLF